MNFRVKKAGLISMRQSLKEFRFRNVFDFNIIIMPKDITSGTCSRITTMSSREIFLATGKN